jgi:hypothetical protein
MTAWLDGRHADDLLESYCQRFDQVLGHLTALLDCAASQEHALANGDLVALQGAADRRRDIMQTLASADAPLQAAREVFAAGDDALRDNARFADVTELHARARTLVAAIAAKDERIQAGLQGVLDHARADSQRLEKGGATLAAYRRIVAPPLDSAELVDRVG